MIMWTDDPVWDAERYEQEKRGRRRNKYLPNEIDDDEEEDEDDEFV